MPVVGFNFKSIKAEIKKVPTGKEKIEISSSPMIKNVEKKKIDVLGKEVALIEFEFKTTYEPGIGQIVLKGEILYQTDNVGKFVKEWKEKKKLSADFAIPVLNAVFRRCLKRAIDLADDLQLPPPIRFPVVRAKEESKYIE